MERHPFSLPKKKDEFKEPAHFMFTNWIQAQSFKRMFFD